MIRNKILEISNLCKNSVSLQYRRESDCYEHIKDVVVFNGDGNGEYFHVSNFLDGELGKCLETDKYWCLHFYPHTPNGFYHAFSNDLDSLLDWALEILKGETI